MNLTELAPYLYFLILFSVIIGYFISVRITKKKLGEKYMDIVRAYQWKCLKGVAPVFLYVIISLVYGNYEKLINGVALSMAAVIFFAMSSHELALGFSLNHTFKNKSTKIALLSRAGIIGLIASTITVILVYTSTNSGFAVFIWQSFLLITGMLLFYVNGSIVNIVKAKYVSINNS